MKKMPLFSVIVTTHLRPLLLERALLSILGQSFGDVEIVLVTDEGSIATKEIAFRHLRETDIFISLPGTKGPAHTRNVGVAHATGRYILFLDDDDTFGAHYLQALVECGTFNDDAVNYVNFTTLTEARTDTGIEPMHSVPVPLGGNDINELLVCNFIPNNAFVVSAAIAAGSSFDCHLPSHEDWDYLMALFFKHPFNFIDIDGPIVHVNETDSRNNKAKDSGSIVLDFISIYRKWPRAEQQIKAKRKDMLKSLGLDLPVELF